MFHAVADLYLLSQCDEAIYSCGSTFAELAWWLGGCKAKVSVVGSYKNWIELKEVSKFRNKFFSITDKCKNNKNYKIVKILGIKIKIRWGE